jgi:hypothetical protein
MNLDEMIGAIRAPDGDEPELAAATQLRVRRSLETRARVRHQLAGILTAIAILFVGTVSWALATGRVAAMWQPARSPSRIEPPVVPPVRSSSVPRAPSIAIAPAPVIGPETVAPPEPAPVAPVPAPVAPVPVIPTRRHPARAADEPAFEALYRSAYQLHHHGGSPTATLTAWDAYLAAEPEGRFVIDARYSRALILIKLQRYADARVALLPFARGDVEAGYRQAEATKLLAAIAHLP